MNNTMRTLGLGLIMLMTLLASGSVVYATDRTDLDKTNCEPGSGLNFSNALNCASEVASTGYGDEAASADLQSVVGTVIRGALTLVGAIFLLMMIYGGYNWMIDRGDAERVKVAKDTIVRAIIGIIIVLGAYAITSFVTSRLSGTVQNSNSSGPIADTGSGPGQ